MVPIVDPELVRTRGVSYLSLYLLFVILCLFFSQNAVLVSYNFCTKVSDLFKRSFLTLKIIFNQFFPWDPITLSDDDWGV